MLLGFEQNSCARGLLLGFMMLCDVIGAVPEFMVRVLCSGPVIGIYSMMLVG